MRPETPAYTYRCVDRSVLVGPFCRYVVRWFVQWMPRAVPANLLTLGSSASMWVMLALAAIASDPAGLAPWCLALMAAYVIYDHADGMHSRRTGTSSPLGEFLDHYADAFHGPITVVVMFLVAGRADSPLLVVLVWAVALAGAAIMVEERERKELHFGVLGPLEGMLLGLAFFASWSHPAAAAWWHAPLSGDFTVFAAVMAGGALGSLVTVVGCVRRIGRMPAGLPVFALAGAVFCALGLWGGTAWWGPVLLLMLHGADYSGRAIASHLRGTPPARADVVAPVLVAVALVARVPGVWPVAAAAIWLVVRNAGLAAGFFAVFGGYWRWRNRSETKPAQLA